MKRKYTHRKDYYEVIIWPGSRAVVSTHYKLANAKKAIKGKKQRQIVYHHITQSR